MRWIIGDIHGMLRPLEVLLDAVRHNDREARFYFVGDYVNRGPDSKRVLDLLLTLPGARFIRGNHDDIFDQILHGTCYAPNASDGNHLLSFLWFMEYGLDRTLLSYGIDPVDLDRLVQRPSAQRLAEMLRCVPSHHRAFIHTLPAFVEEPDLLLLHGKWDIDNADSDLAGQLRRSAVKRRNLLWGRYEVSEIVASKHWRRTAYFGHTPVDNYEPLLKNSELRPVVGPKMVLLDTGCAVSPLGRMTAFCHEMRSYIQVDRFGKLVPATG
jgi:calcineurin-like phosphoesterase family protein